MSVCIFCLGMRDASEPCFYGMHHELDVPIVKKQEKKTNKLLCTKCGLHPKNPAFASSECVHEFDTGGT